MVKAQACVLSVCIEGHVGPRLSSHHPLKLGAQGSGVTSARPDETKPDQTGPEEDLQARLDLVTDQVGEIRGLVSRRLGNLGLVWSGLFAFQGG